MLDALTKAGATELKAAIDNYWATRQDEFYMPSTFILPLKNWRTMHSAQAYVVVSDMLNGQPRRRHKDVK